MNLTPIKISLILFVSLSVNSDIFASNAISIPQIDNSVEEFMEKYNVPGLSIAITRQGRLIYARGYGFADREAEEAVTATSRFRIASLSKPITTVAIMKLVEEQQLSLDAKVFGPDGLLGPRYGMRNPDHPVTRISVLDLLHHTSGGWSNTRGDPMFSNPSLSPDELVVQTLRNRPLQNDPGTTYAYSNFGYFILGRIIEEMAGESYEEFVKNRILLPSGISTMEIGGNTLGERKLNEVKYYPDNQHDPYRYNVRRMDSHGGWIATATDLARFLVHVDGFNTNRNILRHQTIRTMTDPSRANANYACGWCVNEAGNWWHSGSLPGTGATMVRSAIEFNWVILTNKRASGDSGFSEDLDRIVWSAIDNPTTRWPNRNLFR